MFKARWQTIVDAIDERDKLEAKEKRSQAAKTQRLEDNEHPYEAAARIHHHSFKRKFRKDDKDDDKDEEDSDEDEKEDM